MGLMSFASCAGVFGGMNIYLYIFLNSDSLQFTYSNIHFLHDVVQR